MVTTSSSGRVKPGAAPDAATSGATSRLHEPSPGAENSAQKQARHAREMAAIDWVLGARAE
jgi:hypothetical protein